MADFTITLQGKASADEVREAFETVVRALDAAVGEDGDEPFGELVLEGVPYRAEDVPDLEAEDLDGDEPEETPEEPADDPEYHEPGEVAADEVEEDPAPPA